MRPATVRWIAIVAIGGLLAAFVVAAIAGGRGGGQGDTGETDSSREISTPTGFVPGPHVVVQLCIENVCPVPDEATQQAFADELERDGRVASTRLVTSEQAYQLILDQWGDREDLVAETDPDEVPARIEIDLLDPADTDDLVASLKGQQGVLDAHPASSSTG